jgi:hypothetical protein
VAAWSARRARPFAIIEDEELREIFLMLNSIVEIHSRQTVARDISDMYERSRIVIGLHLQSIKHRLHIALDGWTSPNVTSFLGVTVQYFEKGDIHSLVLDFVKYSRLFYATQAVVKTALMMKSTPTMMMMRLIKMKTSSVMQKTLNRPT